MRFKKPYTEDSHAERRDFKLKKKLQPKDNRKSVRLIAKLSSRLKKNK